MGWAVGYDAERRRDIGYGVPSKCDHPKCSEIIDRGMGYVCGGEHGGGEHGCGLYFCSAHLYHAARRAGPLCPRCLASKSPYKRWAPDEPEWVHHKLTDDSWQQWRDENREEVEALAQAHCAALASRAQEPAPPADPAYRVRRGFIGLDTAFLSEADVVARMKRAVAEEPSVNVNPCKDGHSYRRNAPPQAGDICTVCRVAVWQPGLSPHHGVTPSPESQPATNGADGADVLGPHQGGRDLRVEFHQDGSYTVHDTRQGPRKFVRLVTDVEWPPPAPGAGVALSAEQSGYVRQLERLVARVRAGEVRFLRYAATNGTREVENGDIRLIEPTGEVELTLWYQQRVAPDDRALGTASRTENRRHP